MIKTNLIKPHIQNEIEMGVKMKQIRHHKKRGGFCRP